jgi:hypothetical protein
MRSCSLHLKGVWISCPFLKGRGTFYKRSWSSLTMVRFPYNSGRVTMYVGPQTKISSLKSGGGCPVMWPSLHLASSMAEA